MTSQVHKYSTVKKKRYEKFCHYAIDLWWEAWTGSFKDMFFFLFFFVDKTELKMNIFVAFWDILYSFLPYWKANNLMKQIFRKLFRFISSLALKQRWWWWWYVFSQVLLSFFFFFFYRWQFSSAYLQVSSIETRNFFLYKFSFNWIPLNFKKLPMAFFESSSISSYPTRVFLHFSNQRIEAVYLERSIGQCCKQ